MKKILIIGKNGQVGCELQRTLAPLGEIIALDRNAVDLSQPDKIVQVIRENNPSIIVNAAAYTAVDMAEAEPDLTMAINGIAPGIMAEEAKRLGAVLVHYSTDYVFDGRSDKPYHEDAPTCPLNVYGHSKLKGEQLIQTVGGKHFILRTSWVYGARGKNFLLTMLKLAVERDQLKIVSDQVGAPTWSRTIAETTAQVLSQIDNKDDVWGIYNVTAQGQISWYEFATAIFRFYHTHMRHPQVIPIPSSEYPTPARRPAFSVLSHAKIAKTFGLTLPHWQTALKSCLSELRV
jgi:dTDP-4-dehydrorhamnose reductase